MTKVKCPCCGEEFPSNSDYTVSIGCFGMCVGCKIDNNDMYEHDLVWIKFINNNLIEAVH